MKLNLPVWFGLWCLIGLLIGLLTGLFTYSVAHSASVSPTQNTLDKIRRSKTLVVGYNETKIPFSYQDGNSQIVGYSYEITKSIAKAVQQHLGLSELKIEPRLVSSLNRFEMIQNGVVDIECTSTTHNKQRQEKYGFSTTFFITSARLMTRKDAGIRELIDLAGKTVIVRASSTSEALLQKFKAEKKIAINQLNSIERGPSPLDLLQSGQADAYMNDDILLYSAIFEAWRPAEWIVTGVPQSNEAYACTMRKEDTAFKQIVDKAITKLMLSGQMEQLYKKWFLSPIPPQGRALNIPLSDAMKKLFAAPNDLAFD